MQPQMQPARKSRPLLPKPVKDSDPPPSAPSVPGKRKRERALAACESCRRRKIKCDSVRPSCGPCSNSKIVCQYPVPEGFTPRAAQKAQLENASNLRTVLDLLRSTTSGESWSITRRIREAATLEDAVQLITDASLLVPHTITLSPLDGFPSRIPQSQSPSKSPISPDSELRQVGTSDLWTTRPPGPVLRISRWTTVSRDDAYLTHLLNLFWTWDHTLSRIIDRGMFIEDLQSADHSSARFCSEFLVNSLLAVATLFSAQDSFPTTPESILVKARAFAAEAHRIHDQKPNRLAPSLLQGLAMLWVFEGNIGNRAQAAQVLEEFYNVHESLKLDVDLSHLEPLSDPLADRRWEAVSKICWGIYCLDMKFSTMLSQQMSIKKPKIVKSFENSSPTLLFAASAPEQLWTPYPASDAAQLSYIRDVFSAECQLAELTEEVLVELYDQRVVNTQERYENLQALYKRYLDWKQSLPPRLQATSSPLPSVMFLHVTFDMAVLKLLEPFTAGFLNSFGRTTAASLCVEHGISIIYTLHTYRAVYGLRHEYWLMQACFAAASALLPNLEAGAVAVDAFTRACQLLHDMARYMPLADSLLASLKIRMNNRDMKPPKTVARIFAALKLRQGGVLIRGARMGLPARDGQGAEVIREAGVIQDVAFRSLINGVSDVAGQSDVW